MTLDHVGIASTGPEARALFEALLGSAPYRVEAVEREGVTTVFFGDGGAAGAAPKVELLESDAPDSPVARFLASRGPGVHHLAFEVPDVEQAMEHARALGLRLLSETPRAGADGKRIAFLHPKDTAGVLVELLDTPRSPRETVHVPTDAGHVSVHVSGPDGAPPLVVLHGALGSTALETDR
ncbi:MAG TPA: methylmalonyl-CoA epimerase, partial [Rubricoccaceae bacterium]